MAEREEFNPEKVYRRVLMSVKGEDERVEAYHQAMSGNPSLIVQEELENILYSWIKGNCSNKYFVEFTVQIYRMRGISFNVLHLKESRKIEKYKTTHYLAGFTSMTENKFRENNNNIPSSS